MIDELVKWSGPVVAIGAILGSWRLVEHKQAEQARTNESVDQQMSTIVHRVTEIEKREGVANAKREEMTRLLRQNSKDIKEILRELTELATTIRMKEER